MAASKGEGTRIRKRNSLKKEKRKNRGQFKLKTQKKYLFCFFKFFLIISTQLLLFFKKPSHKSFDYLKI